MELRCRLYRKLAKWWELETIAAGCLGSAKDFDRIPFASDLAWALLKQGRPQEAKSVLDKVHYACAPELLFTAACVLTALDDMQLARSLLSDAITFSIDPNAMKLRVLDNTSLSVFGGAADARWRLSRNKRACIPVQGRWQSA